VEKTKDKALEYLLIGLEEKWKFDMKTIRIAAIISIVAIMLSACTGSSSTGHPDLEGTT
jgi:hypothetical protein